MPSVLADFGLVPALQLLSDQYGRTNNIKVNYSTQGLEERLDPAVEVGLYRIGQEALNNISKHSGAKEVTIQLVKDGSTLRFIIEDDGNGFQPHIRLMKEKHGMGLLSMRERARSMKGEFNIDSRPGAGTTIIVEIPLS
jgi:signal transduction histidine kinase